MPWVAHGFRASGIAFVLATARTKAAIGNAEGGDAAYGSLTASLASLALVWTGTARPVYGGIRA